MQIVKVEIYVYSSILPVKCYYLSHCCLRYVLYTFFILQSFKDDINLLRIAALLAKKKEGSYILHQNPGHVSEWWAIFINKILPEELLFIENSIMSVLSVSSQWTFMRVLHMHGKENVKVP